MSEQSRYAILEKNTFARFVPGCPVLYEKSNLLLDNQTKNVLLQAKFRNTSNADVKAFIFDVECYDISKELLDLVSNCQFLDMRVKPGETFGEKQPVFLSSPLTRKTKVIPKKVVFANGNVWTNKSEPDFPAYGYLRLPEPKRISEHIPTHLIEQFKRDCKEAKTVAFLPIINDAYWQCCCGQLNDGTRDKCLNCGAPLSALHDLQNRKALEKRYEAYADKARQEQKAEEEKKTLESEKSLQAKSDRKEKRKAARKKALRVCGIAAAALLLIVGFSIVLMSNLKEYIHAKTLFQSGDYQSAKAAFSQLGDYMNSETMALQCDYAYGTKLLEEGHFADAKTIFQELGAQNYADSSTQLLECDYRSAVSLLENGQFDDAQNIFVDLGTYNDSEMYVQECTYQKAREYLENKQYVWASNLFHKLGNYKDSAEQYCESQYQYGLELMRTANNYSSLAEVAGIFGEIADYKDSGQLIDACKKKWDVIRKAGIPIYKISLSEYALNLDLDITNVMAKALEDQTIAITFFCA